MRFYIYKVKDNPVLIDNKDLRYEQQQNYIISNDTNIPHLIEASSDDFMELLDVYTSMKITQAIKLLKEDLRYGRN